MSGVPGEVRWMAMRASDVRAAIGATSDTKRDRSTRNGASSPGSNSATMNASSAASYSMFGSSQLVRVFASRAALRA